METGRLWFSPGFGRCQLVARVRRPYNRSVAFDPLDPPDPIDVVRRLVVGALAVAGLAAVAAALASGEVPWRLLALVGVLWTMWAFASQLYGVAIAPLGRFLQQQVFTGSVITLDDEIADLEARLAGGRLPPEREVLAGLRLAEIYREHLHDKPRADALLERLSVKYPESTELRVARRLPV